MTHDAQPHLETAEMLEDDGNQKRSMYKDVEVTLRDVVCHMYILVLRTNETKEIS